jgi:glycerophosphoryl diester phosphodiesterase
MTVSIIAHRTCMLDCPENSLAGIRKAAELGADGVEIDVRRTLDGKVVLMHDWSPRRTTGLPGPVAWYHSSLLRRVRLRGGGSERVPTLNQALDALPDGLVLAIEIKDAGAAPRVLESVRARHLEERVLMWSYRSAAVRYFAERAPEIEPALLRDDTDPEGLTRFLTDASEFGARAISAHWHAISPQFIGEAHDRNLIVYSMNRDLGSIPKRIAAGLDGIVTDQPREVRAVLESIPAPPVRRELD